MAANGSGTRAMIVGAGIGGLAAAIGLRRRGIDVAVFEQAPELRTLRVGGGFHIWTNGMRALREVGLEDTARALGAPIERTSFLSWQDRPLAEWPCGEMARDFDTQEVGLRRATLHGMLVDAAADIRVDTAREVSGFEQDEHGVTVRFADGSEERGDVLVGADGLRSRLRQTLLRDGPPRYAGYCQWQTTTATPELLGVGEEQVVFGPGRRAVLHHVDGDQLFWAAVLYQREGGGGRPPGRKRHLLERFSDFPERLITAIEASPEESIMGLDIYDRKPVRRWGEGRVTLLGDAAHPMTTNTSQGGNQALEDAAVLAACLASEPDAVTALRRYEEKRIPRTERLVKQSRFAATVGGFADPVRRRFIHAAMRRRLPGADLRGQRRMVAADF